MRALATAVIGAVLAVVAGVFWRRWRAAQLAARRALATLDFRDRREAMAQAYHTAASAQGKPRGLTWKSCELHPGEIFCVDRVSGQLFALVGVTIAFEAIAGGPMEDVEAVGNLRCATAVFSHGPEGWSSDGKTVFNLEPAETLVQFAEMLQEFGTAAGSAPSV
jgi:hypothetical protein